LAKKASEIRKQEAEKYAEWERQRVIREGRE
jgi:hypothetical protein